MAEGQNGQHPGGKFGLLRRLQDVLFGTDGVRERPPRNSYQIPVRLGVGRPLVFGVLTPSNAAVAYGIRLDLTLTLNIAHMQPFSAKYHALSVSCAILSTWGGYVMRRYNGWMALDLDAELRNF